MAACKRKAKRRRGGTVCYLEEATAERRAVGGPIRPARAIRYPEVRGLRFNNASPGTRNFVDRDLDAALSLMIEPYDRQAFLDGLAGYRLQ